MINWTKKIMRELNKELAQLYSTKETSERIVALSGVDKAFISWQNKPIDNWYNIMETASNRSCLLSLIELAMEEHPDNPVLMASLLDMGGTYPTTAEINDNPSVAEKIFTEEKPVLKNLIAQGKIEEVFTRMRETAQKTGQHRLSNELVLLSSRFQSNESSNRMGVIGNDDYLLERNKIEAALLQAIEYM